MLRKAPPGRNLKKEKSKSDSEGKNAAAGLAIDSSGKTLYAVFNMRNTLAVIDIATGEIKRGNPRRHAPYGVVLINDKAYVTNWAGRHPSKKRHDGRVGHSRARYRRSGSPHRFRWLRFCR